MDQKILLDLIREAERLLYTADWAAGKLDIEMNKRRSMPSWCEFDSLIEKREAIRTWRKRAREVLDAKEQP